METFWSSESRAMLASAMPSRDKIGRSQWKMVNVQCSMFNVQCSMFKIAIERAESQACLGYPEREQFGAKLNVY